MKKLKTMCFGLAVFLALVMLSGAFSYAKEKQIPLLLSTGPTMWSMYPISVTTSDLVTKTTNLNITVRGYDGSIPIVKAVLVRQSHIGLATAANIAESLRGIGDWKQRGPSPKLRAIIVYMELLKTWNVPAKSGIKSVYDLKGRRLANMTAMSGSNQYRLLLKEWGLDPKKDVTWVDVPRMDQAMQEVRMGRAVGWFGDAKGGSDTLELAEAVGPLRALPLDPNRMERLFKEHPNDFLGSLMKPLDPKKEPHLTGTEPILCLSVPMFVFALESLPEDVVYTYTKVWLDNMNTIPTLTEELATWGPSFVKTPSAIPYHGGAVKALKEARMWTDAMAKKQKEMLDLAKSLSR